MAEVIGLVTGIAGLIGLTYQLGRLSYEYIETAHGARRTTSEYLKEVGLLSVALVKLNDALQERAASNTITQQEAAMLSDAIKRCKSEIEDLSKRFTRYKESTLRSLAWPFQERETRALVEMLHRWRDMFDSMVLSGTLHVSTATLREVESMRSSAQTSLILDWIQPQRPSEISRESLQQLCPGTCSWILDHPEFKAWDSKQKGTLLCYGGPGVGKTVLSSFVSQHLRQGNHTTVLSHFFDFRAEADKNHHPQSMARSFLRQLLQSQEELPEEIKRLHSLYVSNGEEPKDWTDLFLSTVTSGKKCYLIVDALDECSNRKQMLKFLESLAKADVKMFLTTRPSADLPKTLASGLSIELSASADDLKRYLQTRLDDDEDLDEILSPKLKIEAQNTIIEHANGVFLLCKMAMESLSLANTPRQAKQILASLPSNLPKAYEVTFARILSSEPGTKTLAIRALSWVFMAARPLTLQELLHALAIEPQDMIFDLENLTTPKAVIGACQGLLQVRGDDLVVSLTHATVHEFLATQQAMHFPDATMQMARVCLIYLTQPELEEPACKNVEALEDRLSNFPLLEYSGTQWGVHSASCETDLVQNIDALLQHPHLLANACQIVHYSRRKATSSPESAFAAIPHDLSQVHVLAFWGLTTSVANLLSSDVDVDARDSLGWTPLHWASARGHAEMVTLLLDKGAEIEAKDPQGWTPLFWSAFWRREGTACVLIARGANIEHRDILGCTPLHIAVSRASLEVCEALLKSGANVNAKSKDGRCAREDGIKSHDSAIEACFKKLNLTTPTASSNTRLESAADIGDEALFRSILEEETAASQKPDWKHPLTPRIEALRGAWKTEAGSSPGIVWNSLLERNAAGKLEQLSYPLSVLCFAILAERRDMLDLLLKENISVREPLLIQPRQRWESEATFTFAHVAVFVNNLSLLQLLIIHGADPCTKDSTGKTALHYAVTLGRIDIIRYLATYNTLVDVPDEAGKTALHLALEMKAGGVSYYDEDEYVSEDAIAQANKNRLEICTILVAAGARVNTVELCGNTPLHAAVSAQDAAVVQFLLQHSADANAPAIAQSDKHRRYQGQGHTPFTWAFYLYPDMARIILKHGPVVVPPEIDLAQRVIKVFQEADIEFVRLAVNLKIRGLKSPAILFTLDCLERAMSPPVDHYRQIYWPGARTRRGVSLHPADTRLAPSRYLDVLKVLIEAKEDVNVRDEKTGDTPLLIAMRHDYCSEILQFLLANGADKTVKNKNGEGILDSALSSGDIGLVKLAIDHVGDASTPISDTVLAKAASRGHIELIEHLTKQPSYRARNVPSPPWLSIARLRQDINQEFTDVMQYFQNNKNTALLNMPNEKDETLLHQACQSGTDKMIEELLQLGADPNAQDHVGDTALHIAARKARGKHIIELLVKNGANVRQLNGYSGAFIAEVACATALHMAVHSEDIETIRAVLEAADKTRTNPSDAAAAAPAPTATNTTTVSDSKKKDAFMTAMGLSLTSSSSSSSHQKRQQRPETRFIDIQASHNSRYSTTGGVTALMIAVVDGNLDIVKLLIERGANINIMGGSGSGGYSALDSARRYGYTEIVELIEKEGGMSFDFY